MLQQVRLPTNELVALLVATSSGLSVYATLATFGLLAHSGLLPLPTQLHLLQNWWISRDAYLEQEPGTGLTPLLFVAQSFDRVEF